jgi:hypothetical protein
MASIIVTCTDIVGFYINFGEYATIEKFINNDDKELYYIFSIYCKYNNISKYIFHNNNDIINLMEKLKLYNSCINYSVIRHREDATEEYYLRGPNIRELPITNTTHILSVYIGLQHPFNNPITEIIDIEKITQKTFIEIIIQEFDNDYYNYYDDDADDADDYNDYADTDTDNDDNNNNDNDDDNNNNDDIDNDDNNNNDDIDNDDIDNDDIDNDDIDNDDIDNDDIDNDDDNNDDDNNDDDNDDYDDDNEYNKKNSIIKNIIKILNNNYSSSGL